MCALENVGGFIGSSDGKESACNAGDLDSISGLERSLEKEMATHSSILAWRIPWTEKPGRLQSMGSQRVRHYQVTNTQSTFRKVNVFLSFSRSLFFLSIVFEVIVHFIIVLKALKAFTMIIAHTA